MAYLIRDAALSDISVIGEIIRCSFMNVAVRFGLTAENCPKHPSNCTTEWIRFALEKGVRYFVLECDEIPCGCVALERATPEVFYLERLAVLPEYRTRGFGRALVEHAFSNAKAAGAHRIEIGIISGQKELKEWYKHIGFTETRRAVFPHLPFEVVFMAVIL